MKEEKGFREEFYSLFMEVADNYSRMESSLTIFKERIENFFIKHKVIEFSSRGEGENIIIIMCRENE